MALLPAIVVRDQGDGRVREARLPGQHHLRDTGHVDDVTPPTLENKALRFTGESRSLDGDTCPGVLMGVFQSSTLLNDHLPGVRAEGGLHGDVAYPRQTALAVEGLGTTLGPVHEGIQDDEHAGAYLLLEGTAGGRRHHMGHSQLLKRPDVGSVQCLYFTHKYIFVECRVI